MHARIHYICICACVHACMRACVHACMCVCAFCVCVCVCVYRLGDKGAELNTRLQLPGMRKSQHCRQFTQKRDMTHI